MKMKNQNVKTCARIRCPDCHKKTNILVYEKTVLINCILQCPACKAEFLISVADLKITCQPK